MLFFIFPFFLSLNTLLSTRTRLVVKPFLLFFFFLTPFLLVHSGFLLALLHDPFSFASNTMAFHSTHYPPDIENQRQHLEKPARYHNRSLTASSSSSSSSRSLSPSSSVHPSRKHWTRLLLAFPLRFFRNRLLPKLAALIAVSYALFFVLYTSYAYTRYDETKTLNEYLTLGIISSSHQSDATDDSAFRPYEFSPDFGPKTALSEGPEYSFSWSHWVNLTELAYHEKEFRFDYYVSQPYFKPPRKSGTTAELRRLGQTYLAKYAPSVAKIIYMGGAGETIILNPANQPLSLFNKAKSILQNQQTNNTDPYEQEVFDVLTEIEEKNLLPPLAKNATTTKTVDRVSLRTENNTFHIDTIALSNPQNPNMEQEFHARMIKHTADIIKKTPKFFHELWLKRNTNLGVHYDWRFFRQVRHGQDASESLHHLVRAWAAFTHQEGVISWLAHGALLGWFWNGLTMPWDADIDVQMPIMELDRLARKYNNTLVVQDPKDGQGRFLIEVSPAYVERNRGNGNNVIDARFIDIRSGLYLDITGLAHNRHDDQNQVGCKTPHYYHIGDLYPLRLTTYEGVPLYIPNNFRHILREEYWGYENPVFQTHMYNKDMRQWVGRRQCDKFTDDNLKFSDTPGGTLTYYGACENDDLWASYNRTRYLTALHDEELSFFKTHENVPKLVEKFPSEIAEYAHKFKPIYSDPRYIEGHDEDN